MALHVYGLPDVTLSVRDLDRSLAFYRTLFGSEVTHRDEVTAQLQTPNRGDALTLQLREAAGIDASAGSLVLKFRLLEPASPDDIALTITHAGGIVEDKGQYTLGEPYVVARDPDGYHLEVFFKQ